MASGASNTLTKELRIELKFVTAGFVEQARVATKTLDSINDKFKTVQNQVRITGNAFTGVAKEAKKLGSREVSSAVKEVVEEVLEKLKRSGDIFEPRRGFVQKI